VCIVSIDENGNGSLLHTVEFELARSGTPVFRSVWVDRTGTRASSTPRLDTSNRYVAHTHSQVEVLKSTNKLRYDTLTVRVYQRQVMDSEYLDLADY